MKPKLLDILLVGNFGAMALENIFSSNLKSQGHRVTHCETFYGFHDNTETVKGKILHKLGIKRIRERINQQVLKTGTETNASIVMFFKGADIWPETLAALKKKGKFLVNYNPDHPLFFPSHNVESQNISKGIRHYDCYISYAQKIVEALRHQYDVKAACLPFGYDDQLTGKPMGEEKAYIFAGGWDAERTKFLTEVAKRAELKVYGGNDWKIRNTLNKQILKVLQHQYLVGDDYKSLSAYCSGVINLLREQNLREGSHNMRTFEVPGFGGVLLSQKTEEQSAFFEHGKEAMFFESLDELLAHMDYLNKNPEVRERIKKNALKRSINSGYSYKERSRQLVDIIQAAIH